VQISEAVTVLGSNGIEEGCSAWCGGGGEKMQGVLKEGGAPALQRWLVLSRSRGIGNKQLSRPTEVRPLH
jgi:hypothetical protein